MGGAGQRGDPLLEFTHERAAAQPPAVQRIVDFFPEFFTVADIGAAYVQWLAEYGKSEHGGSIKSGNGPC
ncbi:hypothetical protein GCM10010261_66630 [Streptomyces pilosus]|uniref:Uncharacterized protein n=1 Tax=Streptomyces pilosus TaxID=28893 RepID=A0A918ETN6_9ACTN|nr:hypothetical protein GCM10010280_10950 [Streptomyces pilosus]GGV70951.1 hypothetical protein GCM10010261_66630 [Streptomyces pilosus]